MLFLGVSAGLPLLLIFSSLSLWLREAGVERATVTFFSWAALGYSFKFLWAPLVDRVPLPVLTGWLGRRRAWMLASQCAVMASMVAMAMTDPAAGEGTLTGMALAAVALGFSSATQDIVIDAYRIEAAHRDLQAMMSASYIAGYRIGTLAAGAGALFLAELFGSTASNYSYEAWRLTYICMALLMLIGVTTTLLVDEPETAAVEERQALSDYLGLLGVFAVCVGVFIGLFVLLGNTLPGVIGEVVRFLVALAGALLVGWVAGRAGLVNRTMLVTSYVSPVADFFRRYGARIAILLLLVIGLYRISDIVLGVIANVFYQDLGFSKSEIASVVKTYGLAMTLLGGFVGGLMAVRFGVMRVLLAGAILTVITNLFFIALAYTGHNVPLLYLVISADNLTAGIASAAFVAFLSSLTSVRFTAVQYAIFSSLMTLVPKLLGGYSGTVVDGVGYVQFFLIAAAIGLPVLVLVWLVGRNVEIEVPQSK